MGSISLGITAKPVISAALNCKGYPLQQVQMHCHCWFIVHATYTPTEDTSM